MAVTSQEALCIVVIIYFFPALFVAAWVCRCHGFGKQLGWLYLVLLCLVRVVGSALRITSEINHEAGISTAADVVSSVGVMTLLLGMLELIDRFESMLSFKPIHQRVWTFLQLAQYAAFILYAVGMGMGRTDLNEASTIIVAATFVVQVAICAILSRYMHHAARYSRLLLVAIISIPFLAVRVAYGIATTFVTSDSPFNRGVTGVVISAFLQYAMEFVAATLFLYAGVVLLPPKHVDSRESGTASLNNNNEFPMGFPHALPSR
ncbi:uncharacterized protein TRIVIDRAFT_60258 [Trichoderma virens Gv29-8]|uniref:DUF7702 domain-containing protein n=1 Tax=Hypocrea virens (strain Gv29-8 / FGSC 10586) TaxID=413071 RepID=G9MS63_HYPVG|nr:uncharacterized protein TRIVIDRAFT_60258 [Trichoderma virens Gv29-8]EHK22925.1 hypothetical protein TRIVIDRAFT_60258 [Trichoderma virens Gv29-8]UKZ47976.1 hypothetical protein TrVGV298_002212 [Trichoderma virens]